TADGSAGASMPANESSPGQLVNSTMSPSQAGPLQSGVTIAPYLLISREQRQGLRGHSGPGSGFIGPVLWHNGIWADRGDTTKGTTASDATDSRRCPAKCS